VGQGRWTARDVPDQSGRIAVVTGASGGLGLETAAVLAGRGATVVLACRDLGKAERAAERIRDHAAQIRDHDGQNRSHYEQNRSHHEQNRSHHEQNRSHHGRNRSHDGRDRDRDGRASVQVIRLDLGSLDSVREAAAEIRSACSRLDLLINNAGVMAVPQGRTADGIERHFGINHLGHFALTGLLLDRLLGTPGSRIVTVSSIGHRMGSGVMQFDDLEFNRDYKPWNAYWQSKLANLLLTYELQARLAAAGADPIALAAHPGNARTELWRNSSLADRIAYRPELRMLTFWFAQSAYMGALATLRAATDPDAGGGEYYGPPGRLQFTGYPVRVESSAASHDNEAARRLWDVSEEMTGVSYRILAPSA
jgi:NAD(P)-dependent dehydrogenase (short-subunit alcohol dehydrogenase family)